jgi:hypothetical protein
MSFNDAYCHTASIDVNCTAEAALNYVADGIKQGEWALGSIEREQIGDGLFAGTSMFSSDKLFVRIRPDTHNNVVFYDVGTDQSDLRPRNIVHCVPGPVVGKPANTCIVTLMTWRGEAESDDAWFRKCVSHKTEMFIIKARLESGG